MRNVSYMSILWIAWNHVNCFKYNISAFFFVVFISVWFWIFIYIYKRLRNQVIKTKILRKKYSNTWYNWLINYIPETIRKSVGDFRDKVVGLFKAYTPKKNHVWERKETKQPKTQKQSEEK